MTEEERIFKGELFASEVPELVAKKLKAHRLSQEYSDLLEEDTAERERILHDLLAAVGEGNINFAGILDEVSKNGVTEYALVEQDRCYEKSPFACMKSSFDHLTKLGY